MRTLLNRVNEKILFIILTVFCIQSNSTAQVRMFYSEVEDVDRKMRPYTIGNLDSLNLVEWRKNNHISTCKVGLYKYDGEELSEESEDEIIYKFNEEGKIIERTYMENKYIRSYEYEGGRLIRTFVTSTKNKKIVQECTLEYDDQGRLVREIKEKDRMELSFLATMGELKNKGKFFIDYTYAEDDLITQINIHSNNGKYEYYRERNIYDDNHNLLENQTCKRGYNDRSDLSKTFSKADCGNKLEYKYDAKGRTIEASAYMPESVPLVGFTASNKPVFIMKSEYNDKDELIKISRFASDGTLESITTYNYDSDGNQVASITMESAGTVTSRTVRSFTDGHLSMIMVSSFDETITSMKSFLYDTNGIDTHHIEHDPLTRKKKRAAVITYQ